ISAGSVIAWRSPTTAAKRAISSGGTALSGISTIFMDALVRFMQHYSAADARFRKSCSWRRRAFEPVVDRLAKARGRNRHNGDGGGAYAIERTQVNNQVCCGFDQVPGQRQVCHFGRTFAARG